MKRVIITLIVLFHILDTFSQNHNDNWYFGVGTGLNFNGSNPTPLTNGQTTDITKKTASISDNNGNLLFYTDGTYIWNKNHQIMQGSTHFLPGNFKHPLIVPFPGDNNKYYVIFTRYNNHDLTYTYSIIDFNSIIDGEVISNDIVFYDSPYSYWDDYYFGDTNFISTIATKHSDNFSYWIIISSQSNDDFYTFKVDQNGINSPNQYYINQFGFMQLRDIVISKDSEKIALATYSATIGLNKSVTSTYSDIFILNFDNSTGIVSYDNANFSLPSLPGSPGEIENTVFSVEFSPSGQYLYVISAEYHMNISNNYRLRQYDISNLSSSNYFNIFSSPVVSNNYNTGFYMRLAKDDRIYIPSKIIGGSAQKISVINNPNIASSGCNFSSNQIDYINFGSTYITQSVPNLVPKHVINPNCENNLFISQPITSNNIYQVSNNITCNNVINDNLQVSFKADNIDLSNGFYVSAFNTGEFTAEIDPCSTSNSNRIVSNAVDNSLDLEFEKPLFSIFPNPNNGNFNIENLTNNIFIEVKIYSIVNQNLILDIGNIGIGEKKSISIHNVLPGIYQIKIIDERNNVYYNKIVIN